MPTKHNYPNLNNVDDVERLSAEFDEEWSFNLDPSFISSEVDNNETANETTMVVDKDVFEDLVATCNSMKIQMKELMEKIEQKQEESFQNEVKTRELETDCDSLEEKNKILTDKYNDLKQRGIQMLEQKDGEIKRMREEMTEKKRLFDEQNKKIETMELIAKQEKAKRKRIEHEMKTADRIIKDAWKEEKIKRKEAEGKCLMEKTEKMALQEKVNEMTAGARGVITTVCPVPAHNLLVERIDVLQRQRDILVDSINERTSSSQSNF